MGGYFGRAGLPSDRYPPSLSLAMMAALKIANVVCREVFAMIGLAACLLAMWFPATLSAICH